MRFAIGAKLRLGRKIDRQVRQCEEDEMIRKSWYFSILLAACWLIFGTHAVRAAYPDHSVRILVTTAPGGGADATARLIAGKLSAKWGQPVVVENRPGADGEIVYDAVAHAAPNGYTLAWVLQAFTVIPAQHKLDYDPIKDFAPISLIAKQPDVLLVNSSFPVNSLSQFIALAKSKPGQLNYGSSGIGSPQFLEMEKLMKIGGFSMLHVGYQGGAGPAQVALLGGEIQALFQPVSTVLGQVRSGKMKALAITGARRHPLMPDVPTIAEASGLIGLENSGVWYGLSAPAHTPPQIVKKLHDDIAEVLSLPDVKRITDAQGLVVVMSTPAEFAQMLREDIPKEAEIMKSFKGK
jgi:tripartite-type tricarboxylate transporter receptor subunit TctC